MSEMAAKITLINDHDKIFVAPKGEMCLPKLSKSVYEAKFQLPTFS